MDTAIGTTSKNLWLYAGTGDYERVTTRNSNVDNLLIGFRDKNFPYYKNVNNVVSAQMLTACQDTSNDSTGVNCPLDSDDRVLIPGGNAEGVTVRDWGWYIKLENSSKVVAEPTVTRGVAYFPIYEPTSSQNQCEAGSAYVCAVDDECGTNFSGRLGTNTGANRTKQCFFVGTGVLSKLVVFGNKLFANIAGASTQEKTDLVQLEGIQEDVEALRSSWREGNF
jgi:type IV pilus assembly protein PilY1